MYVVQYLFCGSVVKLAPHKMKIKKNGNTEKRSFPKLSEYHIILQCQLQSAGYFTSILLSLWSENCFARLVWFDCCLVIDVNSDTILSY
jgi:hypothetical protein